MLQDLVARHDASLDLVKGDEPSELDERAAFVPGDGARVGFEETEDFVAGGDLFVLQHALARVGDDALDQGEDLLSLLHQAHGRLLRPRVQHPHDFFT